MKNKLLCQAFLIFEFQTATALTVREMNSKFGGLYVNDVMSFLVGTVSRKYPLDFELITLPGETHLPKNLNRTAGETVEKRKKAKTSLSATKTLGA